MFINVHTGSLNIIHTLGILLLSLCNHIQLVAQDNHEVPIISQVQISELEQATKDSTTSGWLVTMGLGTDIAQLLQINPKVGAGTNRIGLGWAINSSAQYRKERLAWDNSLIWGFSIQRLGKGIFENGKKSVPFQKSIDEFRLGSKLGYKFTAESRFFYAVDFSFISQMTNTYAGNYLRDVQEPDVENDPISRFLSPAQATFSIGIDYKPNDHLSIFFSPIGYKAIIVANDGIADDVVRNSEGMITGSVHGNPITKSTDEMQLVSFKNIQNKLGSLFRASYVDKFLKDRIAFTSGLAMYYNYSTESGKVDLDWTTETAFIVFKGLQISLLTNLFYDYDVFSYRTNNDLPEGIEPVPRRDLLSFTEQFLIKYNIVF